MKRAGVIGVPTSESVQHAERRDVKQACWKPATCSRPLQTVERQSAASFSFFSARVLIFTVAGLAAKTRSTFVNGSRPVRFFFAGALPPENRSTAI